MNYYEHHIGDYDADTAHLSWTEDMAYTRLMRLYYRREAPIPGAIADACRLIRATTREQRTAVEAVLHEFFELDTDGWHQKRCDEELARFLAKAERNRLVGQLGGRPRKPETHEKPTGLSMGSEREPKHNPHQTPDTREVLKNKTSRNPQPPGAAAPVLPGWLDPALWQSWRDQRVAAKARMTPKAEVLLLGVLTKLRAEGQDPKAVVEQSISNGWKGFFPVRSPPSGNGQHKPPRSTRYDTRKAFNESLYLGHPPADENNNVIDGTAERVD